MHYYQHHIGDYNAHTAALTVMEHGVYRLLMDVYYVTEKPLPDDLPALVRICRALDKAERKAVVSVVEKLFEKVEGKLVHRRIEADLATYHKQAETSRTNGKKGGRPKQGDAKAGGNPAGFIQDSKTEPGDNRNQYPSTNNHDPLSSNHVLLGKEPKPPYPQRGDGEGEVFNEKEETPASPGTSADRGSRSDWVPTPEQQRINSWYNRRDTTRWSVQEMKAFRRLPETTGDEWDKLEKYCLRAKYRRRDIITLLNHWAGELDRARVWKPEDDVPPAPVARGRVSASPWGFRINHTQL